MCDSVDKKPDLMSNCARKSVSTEQHPILAIPTLDGLFRFESGKFTFRLNANLPFIKVPPVIRKPPLYCCST
jgi:hypothetical protein